VRNSVSPQAYRLSSEHHWRIIRGAMDEKERQLFTLMWTLLGKYSNLLGDVLPVISEIREVLVMGVTPSPEQLHSWKEKSDVFDQEFYELTAKIEALRPIADPLFVFDA
jgi:hypothetical protein